MYNQYRTTKKIVQKILRKQQNNTQEIQPPTRLDIPAKFYRVTCKTCGPGLDFFGLGMRGLPVLSEKVIKAGTYPCGGCKQSNWQILSEEKL